MVVLSLTVFFRIDEIKIECAGELPYSEQEIIAASGISLNENILTCDADGVGAKLSKALPYIGDATVKRSLNGRVVITVELTPGCYSFSLGENIVVVDPDGKVLEHKAEQPEDVYTEIVGADLSQATPGEKVELVDQGIFTLLDDIYTKLENAGVSGVTSIDVTDVYDVTIVYDGRITMEIGDTNNIDKKLALAAMVIQRENQIDPEQHGVIDLGSVEGKAFFRPVEAPEEPTEDV
jgi:cell division septal protein FtsQ